MMKFVDSKGTPLKTNQKIKIYLGRKLIGQGLIKTKNRQKVVYRIGTRGDLSKEYCLLSEVIEKSSRILVISDKT